MLKKKKKRKFLKTKKVEKPVGLTLVNQADVRGVRYFILFVS